MHTTWQSHLTVWMLYSFLSLMSTVFSIALAALALKPSVVRTKFYR